MYPLFHFAATQRVGEGAIARFSKTASGVDRLRHFGQAPIEFQPPLPPNAPTACRCGIDTQRVASRRTKVCNSFLAKASAAGMAVLARAEECPIHITLVSKVGVVHFSIF